MQCASCGHRFPGLAAHCPRCGSPLPVVPPLVPIADARLGTGQRVLVAAATILAGGVAFAAAFYIAFLLFFCISFDFGAGGGPDPCASQERDSRLFAWLVMLPATVAAMAAAGWLTRRLLLRRNRRRVAR